MNETEVIIWKVKGMFREGVPNCSKIGGNIKGRAMFVEEDKETPKQGDEEGEITIDIDVEL